MHDHMEMQQVREFIVAAVEASVIESPHEPGLTYPELVELGAPLGFKKGQIERHLSSMYSNDVQHGPHGRLVPASLRASMLCGGMGWEFDPDPMNRRCLAFVNTTLKDLADEEGDRHAYIERTTLVHRGEAAGLPARDMEAAIAMMLLAEALVAKDGVIRYKPGQEWVGKPVSNPGIPKQPLTVHRHLAAVRDIIARRTDGRPSSTDPLRGFEERLGSLGFKKFQTWWRQLVGELQRTDPQLAPVASIVLSAALCEAVLIFVGDRARTLGKSMQFRDVDRPPRQWRMDQLATAARNGDSPVLTPPAADRCIDLNRMRQRVHMSRLIDPEDNPPTPDTNPQEAREAKATAELVVGQALKWLESNPG